MARFKRLKVLNEMEKVGVIPVFFNKDIEISKKIVSACAKGGANVIEMTNRADFAYDVFKQLELFVKKNHPNVILGVGSIVDSPTAALYISNGANFIVGPSFDKETAILCNKRKIPYSPGCGSATEIHVAESYGVEICKVFPGAQVGGPAFVKAVKGPCPWTSIMPTGGVDATEESLTNWFSAGVTCVGIGSKLITSDIIANNEYDKLTENIKKTIGIIKSIRSGL